MIADEYQDYLRDESRTVGHAEHISFPVSAQDVHKALIYAGSTPITIQGARTGLAAGAVPQGGHVINLSKLNKITSLRYDDALDVFYLSVQPGVLLTQVKRALKELNFDTLGWSESSLQALNILRTKGPCFFSPDPTETSATIGGMVACNASGARSYFYGPTRNHIEQLTVMLSNGSVISLKRGRDKVVNGHFSITTDNGNVLSGELPTVPLPQVKNAAGYYLQDNMELIDLFIGSEGTLGIITEIELRLLPLPAAIWGATVFLPDLTSSLRFVHAVRAELSPVAIEFFDHCALNLLRKYAQVEDLQNDFHTAIYVEFHGQDEAVVRDAVLKLGQVAEHCGGSESNTWVATNPHDLEKLHLFRHATPETVNSLIDKRKRQDSRITKLGTDMAVPDSELATIINLYNKHLAEENLEAVMFGHIGDNHIHVNILPRSIDDYVKGKAIYLEWAQEVIKLGGSISAEHGVGKMKVAMLREMVGESGINKMQLVKMIFDPAGILSPGNLFLKPLRAGE